MKLTRNEEVLLLTIWRLGDSAYGVTIKTQIKETTGKDWNYGTLYFTLDQLVKKGMLNKEEGQPLAERGGRRKIYYHLSDVAVTALKLVLAEQQALWDGLRPLTHKSKS
ncbi:helix-turn-helix transcriptional regulator [bacterium]|nr:helix-turn-helix transcriptional regulator [bacterium]